MAPPLGPVQEGGERPENGNISNEQYGRENGLMAVQFNFSGAKRCKGDRSKPGFGKDIDSAA